ncbi:MAG: helix-turn-helix domain-containing protein [Patescibacteria group bacterium]|nr:helix-turn-helix domain-containing protein [Patescibacteria group bacterium]
MNYSELDALGLSKSEITVFIFLLKNGHSTPVQIASGTGIQQPHCYGILDSLAAKGLISTQGIKNKRKAFFARDPQALLDTLRARQEAVERILPDLRGLYVSHKNKPQIQFFDGSEEVKNVYRLSLQSQAILGIGSTERIRKAMPDFLEWYLKEVKKRGIVFRDILSGPSADKAIPLAKAIAKALYEAKTFSVREGEASMDILVWDDSVGFVTFDEPIFGTVITSQPFATMFRMLFNALWARM